MLELRIDADRVLGSNTASEGEAPASDPIKLKVVIIVDADLRIPAYDKQRRAHSGRRDDVLAIAEASAQLGPGIWLAEIDGQRYHLAGS